MPRAISSNFRNLLEASSAPGEPRVFATITHAQLATPIRVVDDNCDYIWGGQRYFGVSFQIALLSDDESPPRAAVGIMNVDRKVSDALLALADAPTIKIDVLSGADFGAYNAADNSRSAIGTPAVEYSAPLLRLRNVRGDAQWVSGEIVAFDYAAEPWPKVAGTQDRLPGLFR